MEVAAAPDVVGLEGAAEVAEVVGSDCGICDAMALVDAANVASAMMSSSTAVATEAVAMDPDDNLADGSLADGDLADGDLADGDLADGDLDDEALRGRLVRINEALRLEVQLCEEARRAALECRVSATDLLRAGRSLYPLAQSAVVSAGGALPMPECLREEVSLVPELPPRLRLRQAP